MMQQTEPSCCIPLCFSISTSSAWLGCFCCDDPPLPGNPLPAVVVQQVQVRVHHAQEGWLRACCAINDLTFEDLWRDKRLCEVIISGVPGDSAPMHAVLNKTRVVFSFNNQDCGECTCDPYLNCGISSKCQPTHIWSHKYTFSYHTVIFLLRTILPSKVEQVELLFDPKRSIAIQIILFFLSWKAW